MKRNLSVLLILSIALTAVFAGGGAEKEVSSTGELEWPTQSINIVVAFGAGGASDYNTRAIAKYLTVELGQPVVVTNVGGSGGTIASSQVKDSKADGYTILCNQLSMNMAQAVGMVDYGFEDFGGACVFSRSADEVLTVRADAPWNSIEELIADSKANPGKYKLTANTGASTQWIAVALQNAGAELNIVSSGGSGERLQLLLGSHVDMIPMPLSMVEDYVKTGEFKILANVSPVRSERIPDVPTLLESGVDCSYFYNNTFFFPKGTDDRIVQKFADACEKIITTNEEYREEVASFAQDPAYMNPSDTHASYKKELDSLLSIRDQLVGK